MKILMVSSFLPFPLFSGGHVRLYNLIKELSPEHEITLICEKRSHQTPTDVTEVQKICKKVITVDRRKQWSFVNLAKSLGSKNSFLVTGHTHKEMQKKIAEELEKEKFDLIHVETFYVMQNLPEVAIPVVLAEHNIEYLVYNRYAEKISPVLRPAFLLDVNKIKQEEEKFWKKANKLIAVSKEDKAVMEKTGVHPLIVANGVDTKKFSFNPSTLRQLADRSGRILFIGDFKWIQNVDAATFIIKEIWPFIRDKQKVISNKSSIKLWIVGRKIPDPIKNLTKDPNIIFDEVSSAKPTEELFHEANELLAPIRVGGGTSYKILESMSSGTPVVTMPMSADAIGAKDNEELLVGRNAEELAEKTLRLLEDEKLYEKIAKRGRALIEEKYTWKKIAKDLEDVYKSVI